MKNLLIANWKANASQEKISTWCQTINNQAPTGVPNVNFVFCPPAAYLAQASKLRARFALGSQDVSRFATGAYTGENTANMLRDLGCDYVIIGHSERRSYFNEGDDVLSAKLEQSLAQGLKIVFCIGENLLQRENKQTEQVLIQQLKPIFDLSNINNLVIAYEPVWAIGSGKAATSEQVFQVHQWLRELIQQKMGSAVVDELAILYGGSVKASNARELFQHPAVNGFLVGGASLNADDFLAIYRAMEK